MKIKIPRKMKKSGLTDEMILEAIRKLDAQVLCDCDLQLPEHTVGYHQALERA